MKEPRTDIPFFVRWVLRRTLPVQDLPYLIGNFEDLYVYKVKNGGRVMAGLWLWKEIFKSFPGFLWVSLYWRLSMFKNHLTIALRNMKKNKVFSLINISGLALGMAVCMLIFLWVQDELGFDRFHTNRDSIAQVYSVLSFGDNQSQVNTGSYYPLARTLEEELPEILEATRYQEARELLIAHGDRSFTNDVVGLADPSFFHIFTFPFVAGNPETALSDKFSVVLTESMARKYFGNEDPVGKVLTVAGSLDLRVEGVMADLPSQSSLRFDCVAPFILNFGPSFTEPEHWGGNPLQTYVLLPKEPDLDATAGKVTAVVEKHNPRETGEEVFHLHPLTKIHLYSLQGNSLIRSIFVFSFLALFILVIACINFMNLSTAQATTRAKEVGLRKVVGARKFDLVRQFIGESFTITLITLGFAVFLLRLFLPTFNRLVGKQLSLGLLLQPTVLLGVLGIALFTGFFAGSYPSFFLAAYQPSSILRGMNVSGRGNLKFRKTLVVVQFSLSIFMIISMTVTFKQLRYLQKKDLGFDRENLITFSATQNLRSRFDTFKEELQKNTDILSITKSLQGPWNIGSTVSAVDWDGKNPEEKVNLNWDYVDYDYFKTLDIEILQGRPFSKEFPSDEKGAYLINEKAAELLGMESPVGNRLSVFRKEGSIIGVTHNFHFQPLYHEIKPFVFILRPDTGSRTLVRIEPGRAAAALKHIESVYDEFEKDLPFNPVFFNDVLKRYIYTSEIQTSKISGYFTLLAIVISCLGLFGLAVFLAERRTKEIGVRKVLGASVSSILLMLSKDFTKWVGLANIFAWPAAYFFLRKMLEKYAYSVRMGWEVFFLSGLAALLIAMVAVSYHALKAAWRNPAHSLRYE